VGSGAVDLINDLPSAADLVGALAAQAEDALARAENALTVRRAAFAWRSDQCWTATDPAASPDLTDIPTGCQ